MNKAYVNQDREIVKEDWSVDFQEHEEGTIDQGSMVRIYKTSMNSVNLQIRHLGRILSTSRTAKPKMMLATAVLTLEEMKELADGLNAIIDTIESE